MLSLPKPRCTPEEYLALERAADHKSEYLSFEIFAMAGATRRHNLIGTNVSAELRAQLRGRPCETYANDMHARVAPTGLYTDPDVLVACGEREFLDDDEDTLLNPTVIVEVLSKPTEAYDRGKKFAHYRRLPSLGTYLLISQNTTQAEQYIRRPDGFWLFSEARELGDTLTLPAIDCRLAG